MQENGAREKQRHDEWRAYCGGTTLRYKAHAPHSPVWNVVTDGTVIPNHSDIMGEPLHAFFRQLYLDLPQ